MFSDFSEGSFLRPTWGSIQTSLRQVISHLRERADALLGDKQGPVVRYLAVSVINIVNHQTLLYIANSVWEWSGGLANVFAAFVVSVPGYFLSRAWVWQRSGNHSWRGEVLPFWGIALAGLVVSSIMAEAADRVFASALAVAIASLVGYLIVWIAKFFLLDRLFAGSRAEEMAI